MILRLLDKYERHKKPDTTMSTVIGQYDQSVQDKVR